MKLKDVSRDTGISRRTIHFYIQEGLIAPAQDQGSGYYEFSEDDVRKLSIIRSLRDARFSIAQIRAIMKKPATAVYYLNMQIRALRAEAAHIGKIADALTFMQQSMPIHPDAGAIDKLIRQAGIPAEMGSAEDAEDIDAFDSDLVNRFLWESFLPDGPFTDYQEYLWAKINRTAAGRYAEEYRTLSAALHRLSEERIEVYFTDNRKVHEKMVTLHEDEYASCAEKMKTALRRFSEDPSAIRQWKASYRDILRPSSILCDSALAETMEILSPAFHAYRVHVNAVCGMVYDYLKREEGRQLAGAIERALSGQYNLEHCRHGELQAMVSFF